MGTKAFSLNSQAKYQTGGHFKEKAIRGVILWPCSQTSSPTISALRSLETLQWQTRYGKSGKTLPSAGGSASFTLPSCAPLPVAGFHMRTTSKRRSIPFLPAFTASTSTIRRRLLEELLVASQIPPPKPTRHSKGRPPHQPGPFTRGHSLRPRQMATARLPVPPEYLRRPCRCSGGRAERWACDGPRRRKNGPRGNRDSSWSSGDLGIVSLASPEQPRETGFLQQ